MHSMLIFSVEPNNNRAKCLATIINYSIKRNKNNNKSTPNLIFRPIEFLLHGNKILHLQISREDLYKYLSYGLFAAHRAVLFPSLTVTNRVLAIKISQCPPTMFQNIIYLTALSRYGFTHVDISGYCFLMQACTNVAVVTSHSACFKQLNESKFSTDILKNNTSGSL